MIIVLCVSVVTVYVREGHDGPLHRFQSFCLDAVSPVGEALGDLVSPIKEGVVNLWHLPSLSKEKEDLQKEVALLRSESLENEELKAQNRELKRQLNWSSSSTDYKTVGAEVVGQSPDNWQRLMILNSGSSSGVSRYMAVVTDAGLVGRVISVGSRSSVVQLITDSRSDIGIRNVRSRETGVLVGRNSLTLSVDPMSDNADFKVGDIIETSGLGGTCPAGIIVGKVTKVTKRSEGLSKIISIEPYVQFSKLDNVLIIISPEPESVILKDAQ